MRGMGIGRWSGRNSVPRILCAFTGGEGEPLKEKLNEFGLTYRENWKETFHSVSEYAALPSPPIIHITWGRTSKLCSVRDSR